MFSNLWCVKALIGFDLLQSYWQEQGLCHHLPWSKWSWGWQGRSKHLLFGFFDLGWWDFDHSQVQFCLEYSHLLLSDAKSIWLFSIWINELKKQKKGQGGRSAVISRCVLYIGTERIPTGVMRRNEKCHSQQLTQQIRTLEYLWCD